MYDILTLEDWIRRLYVGMQGASMDERLWLEPYTYNVNFANVAAVGGTASGVLAINANADFVLLRLDYEAVLSAVMTVSTKPVALVRAQITDAGNGNPFFSTAVPLEMLTSHAYQNRMRTYPRFLNANTTLQINLTGYGVAAETYTSIDLSFDGVRARRYSGGLMASSMGN